MFRLSHLKEIQKKARIIAVNSARAKAELIAEELYVNLGYPISIIINLFLFLFCFWLSANTFDTYKLLQTLPPATLQPITPLLATRPHIIQTLENLLSMVTSYPSAE